MLAAIDLGGTTISAAIASPAGSIVAADTIATDSHEGPPGVLARMGALVSRLAAQAGARPEALGVGVPGLIDFTRGETLFLPNFPTQWRGVPVAATLGATTGCPVFLLNDARAAALGELHFGHGRGARSMVFFTLGTGIGGGIVLDGKLRMGPLGAAGEIGHQTVIDGGPLCGCGNHGCLEAVAAAPAVAAEGVRLMKIGLAPRLHALTGGDAARVTPKTMMEAGDDTAREAIVRAARYLGIGAANLVTALHPDLIVLGGGMSAIGPLLTETVRAEIRARVRMFPPDDVRVEISELGDRAGLMGGIALAARRGEL